METITLAQALKRFNGGRLDREEWLWFSKDERQKWREFLEGELSVKISKPEYPEESNESR